MRPKDNPVSMLALALTGGDASELKGYLPMMKVNARAPKVQLADKEYDAGFIPEDIEQCNGMVMIATKPNRRIQVTVNSTIYSARNTVESCFNQS